MKIDPKIWHDETLAISKIEGLSLASDKLWNSITVTVKGTHQKTDLKMSIKIGNATYNHNLSFKDGFEKKIEYPVNQICSISVEGRISKPAFSGITSNAGARITLEACYSKTFLRVYHQTTHTGIPEKYIHRSTCRLTLITK